MASIWDLRLIIDSRLHFDTHIEFVSKAFKMFGFVLRACQEFKCPNAYIYLYCALLRPRICLDFRLYRQYLFYSKLPEINDL